MPHSADAINTVLDKNIHWPLDMATTDAMPFPEQCAPTYVENGVSDGAEQSHGTNAIHDMQRSKSSRSLLYADNALYTVLVVLKITMKKARYRPLMTWSGQGYEGKILKEGPKHII